MNSVEILDLVRPKKSGCYKVDVRRGERKGRVSSEWFNRPDGERYFSLDPLHAPRVAHAGRLLSPRQQA